MAKSQRMGKKLVQDDDLLGFGPFSADHKHKSTSSVTSSVCAESLSLLVFLFNGVKHLRTPSKFITVLFFLDNDCLQFRVILCITNSPNTPERATSFAHIPTCHPRWQYLSTSEGCRDRPHIIRDRGHSYSVGHLIVHLE
jgi:hypothetical protein